ncbi:RCC1 domain-containing protein [Sorangium sp. So ce861]|uniref:RCC1 domain-containing protein n=1 Tax=Sorangium sp. So ce861 TaxID=3133323 RepID=UPI003F62C65F
MHAATALAAILLSACGPDGGAAPQGAPEETEALGSAPNALDPLDPPDHTAQGLSAGMNHACAVLKTGALKCWGANARGQLGLGDVASRGDSTGEMGAALHASFGQGISAVTAGHEHTCALLREPSSPDVGLKCWGRNDFGQLGQPEVPEHRGDDPVEMLELFYSYLGAGATVKAAQAGAYHTCAVLNGDQLKCWGLNANGQLGLGDLKNRGDAELEMFFVPTIPLGGGRTAKSVAAGAYHTCVLLDDDRVKCWGRNDAGQLGLGDLTQRGGTAGTKPEFISTVPLDNLDDKAKAIVAGTFHTCAILGDDTVKCWGDNEAGQLGQDHRNNLGGTLSTTPETFNSIPLGGPVKALSAGSSHTCAILGDGTVKCWGDNQFGQLGLGDTEDRGDDPGEIAGLLPVDLGPGLTAKAIAAGAAFTCALLNTDQIKCWGHSKGGALGFPGCSGAMSHCGDEPGEMGALLPMVDLGPDELSVGGCGSPAVVLSDALANKLCLHGTGTLDLAKIPLGTAGNHWDEDVRSLFVNLPPGDPNWGGLLYDGSCSGFDCSSQHFTGASAGFIEADATGQAANHVALFHLKEPIPTAEMTSSAPRFIVSDVNMTPASIPAAAQESTFVWSGERHTNGWTEPGANPDAIVGHYMPMSGVDDGGLARCQADADCLLEGYHCVLFDTSSYANDPLRDYYKGANVCVPTSEEMRDCEPDEGFDGTKTDTFNGDLQDASCKANPDITKYTVSIAGKCSPINKTVGAPHKCFHSLKLKGVINYRYWDATHPDWILRMCYHDREPRDGRTNIPDPTKRKLEHVVWWGDENPAFDFTNPEVIDAMLGQIRARWATGRRYDALSLDVMHVVNFVGACGVYEGGTTWKPKYNGRQDYDPVECAGTCDPEDPACAAREGYCDWQYTREAIKWLKRLRDEMHKDGKRLVANVHFTGSIAPTYSIPASDPTFSGPGGVFDTLDGVFTETGFNFSKCGSYSYDASPVCPDIRYNGAAVNLWSNMHGYMLDVQSRSKPFYLKTAIHNKNGGPAQDAEIEWSLANYLVSEAGLASLYVALLNGDSGASDFPHLEAQLGAACGAPDFIEAPAGTRVAVTRRFSGGFAAVNFRPTPTLPPPAADSVTVSLPAGTFTKWNPSSQAYDAPVDCSSAPPAPNDCVIPPQRGRVFVRQGAPSCP